MRTGLSANDLLFLLSGVGTTLLLTFWALLGGTVFGTGLGLLRAVLPPVPNAVLGGLLDVPRSVPLLIQFVLVNSAKSIVGLDVSAFVVACLVLALYAACYCAEIVRGGVLAVPATTRRAARSLGMSYGQDLLYVVAPLALRVALPSWTGLALGVMKDTALVLWIGIIELLRSSQILITRLQEPLLILGITGAIYFCLSFPITRLSERLERRWRDHD